MYNFLYNLKTKNNLHATCLYTLKHEGLYNSISIYPYFYLPHKLFTSPNLTQLFSQVYIILTNFSKLPKNMTLL
jgi:hypothetical protein